MTDHIYNLLTVLGATIIGMLCVVVLMDNGYWLYLAGLALSSAFIGSALMDALHESQLSHLSNRAE